MGGIFKNKFLLFSVIGGVIVVAIVSYVLLSLSATTTAVVLNADTSAGTTITESMLEEIEVPADTPGDYYKSASSLVGERLVTDIPAGQLIYASDVLSSVSLESEDTSENFITTMIRVADDNALGGLLTAGDVVDIAVIPASGYTQILATALSDYNIDTSYDGGFYYILANVTLLDTTTAVSSSQGTTLTTATSDDDSSSTDYSYYLISLSYNDYKKLRIAEQFGTLYLNLVPSQNSENGPLLEIMAAQVTGGLSDASVDDTYSSDTTTDTTTDETTDETSTDIETDELGAEAVTTEDEELDEAA